MAPPMAGRRLPMSGLEATSSAPPTIAASPAASVTKPGTRERGGGGGMGGGVGAVCSSRRARMPSASRIMCSRASLTVQTSQDRNSAAMGKRGRCGSLGREHARAHPVAVAGQRDLDPQHEAHREELAQPLETGRGLAALQLGRAGELLGDVGRIDHVDPLAHQADQESRRAAAWPGRETGLPPRARTRRWPRAAACPGAGRGRAAGGASAAGGPAPWTGAGSAVCGAGRRLRRGRVRPVQAGQKERSQESCQSAHVVGIFAQVGQARVRADRNRRGAGRRPGRRGQRATARQQLAGGEPGSQEKMPRGWVAT